MAHTMEMIKVSNYNGDLFSVPKDYNKSISNFNKKPRISMFNKKTQSPSERRER